MFDHWTKDAAGNITFTPLIEFETTLVAGMAIGLRLALERPGDERGKPSGSVQMALTPVQAKELAHALQQAAASVTAPPLPGLKPI